MKLEAILDHVRPLGDRVLLKRLSDKDFAEQSPGGIIIPEASQQVHQGHMQGEVIAVGNLVSDPHLLPGMRVVCGRYRQAFVGDEGEYFVTNEDNIHAILFPEES